MMADMIAGVRQTESKCQSLKTLHQYDGFCGQSSCRICFRKWLANNQRK